jgi:lysine 6-dehydrogenase
MFTYVVYGLGRVGVCAVYDLIKNCDAKYIVAVDPDDAARFAGGDKLDFLLSEEERKRVEIRRSDDGLGLWQLGVDVVVNCATHTAILDITNRCLNSRVPVCDLGGNPDVVEAQEAMEPQTPVVADCGISPGISNIIAADFARKGYKQIRVRCGGIPQNLDVDDPTGLQYKLVFSPEGLLSEYSGIAYVIHNGEVQWVDALDGIARFEDYEAAFTSNNSRQVVDYLQDLGVQFYDYKTLRYPGHWDAVRSWRALGYLSGDAEADANLADRLRKSEHLVYDPRDPLLQDMLILSVEGHSGKRMQHSKRKRLTVRHNNTTGFSAMEQATAWGITTIAHAIAADLQDVPKGFSTPEQWVSGDYIISELAKRDY